MELLKIFGLTLLIHTVYGKTKASISFNPQVATLGGNATISCLMTSLEPRMLINIRRKNPKTKEWITISTNIVKDLSVDRYSISMVPHDVDGDDSTHDYIAQLIILGIEAEDNGLYQCYVTQDPSVAVEKDFTVVVPPEEVSFHNLADDSDITDTSLVFKTARPPINVQCVVQGGHPAPDVQVLLGDQDVTENFEKTEQPRYEDGSTVNQKVLMITETVVTLESEANLKLSYAEHNQTEVQCIARTPRFDANGDRLPVDLSSDGVVSGKFTIDFQMVGFVPELNCPSSVRSFYYHTHVNISCSVDSIPSANNVTVTFARYGETENVTVSLDTVHKHYSLVMDVQDGQQVLTLKIDRVFAQSFREYNFHVSNNVGRADAVVALVVDASQSVDAGIIHCSSFLLMVSAVLFHFLRHL